ncbi:hypothetical protein [Pseudomonas sp. SLFW]|uniref:hypothetical protein n=1 Tax=Pseudomonas sp. SLFW TaxID=2683259 RepID=UPI0014120553|nr:hypothetical protein [Pseudomonas sp. SLFW]NBB12969.1 hypothetical protein [Pseudomonas sp. SLFW]
MPLTRRGFLMGGAALCLPGAASAAVGFNWTTWPELLAGGDGHAQAAGLPDAAIEHILERGGWSPSADDNIQGETLDVGFVKTLMLDYRNNPQNSTAQQGLGLIALTLGVAQWGIDDPSGLPPDPVQNDWKSQTSANTGKHLMSYGVGGVGIAHMDQGDLLEFITYVAQSGLVPAEHKVALLRLADPALYPAEGVGVYGQLRAAGLCAPVQIEADLEGAAFKHFSNPHYPSYCDKYRNPSLTSLDWQTFRTFIRAALRTKAGQRWLFQSWLEKYWTRSLAAVPAGEGAAEELLVNVRLRNSLPACADRAVKTPASDVEGRVRRELEEYAKCAPSAYERRATVMLRSVVLYRHFTGAAPLNLT